MIAIHEKEAERSQGSSLVDQPRTTEHQPKHFPLEMPMTHDIDPALTGSAFELASAGYTPMRDPEEKPDQESIGGDVTSLRDAADRLGERDRPVTVREYVDAHGKPAAANEAVTLARAARDHARSRAADRRAVRRPQRRRGALPGTQSEFGRDVSRRDELGHRSSSILSWGLVSRCTPNFSMGEWLVFAVLHMLIKVALVIFVVLLVSLDLAPIIPFVSLGVGF